MSTMIKTAIWFNGCHLTICASASRAVCRVTACRAAFDATAS